MGLQTRCGSRTLLAQGMTEPCPLARDFSTSAPSTGSQHRAIQLSQLVAASHLLSVRPGSLPLLSLPPAEHLTPSPRRQAGLCVVHPLAAQSLKGHRSTRKPRAWPRGDLWG